MSKISRGMQLASAGSTTGFSPDVKRVYNATTYYGTGNTQVISTQPFPVGLGGNHVDDAAGMGVGTPRYGAVLMVNHGSGQIPTIWPRFAGAYSSNISYYFETASDLQIQQDVNAIASWQNDGFQVSNSNRTGNNGSIYTAHFFQRSKRFFDVVSWTGSGYNNTQDIAHSLGVAPGMIWVKDTISEHWRVYHRGMDDVDGANTARTQALRLNSNIAAVAGQFDFTTQDPDENKFVVKGMSNQSSRTYIAFLWAHDTEDDSIIKSVGYTGNGSSSGQFIDLGFEPQTIILKVNNAVDSWYMTDVDYGLQNTQSLVSPTDGTIAWSFDSSGGMYNSTQTQFILEPNGVRVFNSGANTLGNKYNLTAIRKDNVSPDKSPSYDTGAMFQGSKRKYYGSHSRSGTGTTAHRNFIDASVQETKPDLWWTKKFGSGEYLLETRRKGRRYRLNLFGDQNQKGAENPNIFGGGQNDGPYLQFNQVLGAVTYNGSFLGNRWSTKGQIRGSDAAFNQNAVGYYDNWFKEAPGFLHTGVYEGDNTARTQRHGLEAVPKMIWIRALDATGDAYVYHAGMADGTANQPHQYTVTLTQDSIGNVGFYRQLNNGIWNNTAPTSTHFSLGANSFVNSNSVTGGQYQYYCMGDVPGLSKCGSFYWNTNVHGNSFNVDCGFGSDSARFVTIKNVDQLSNNLSAYGQWYWWDNARGIVSGNDTTLTLNNPNFSDPGYDIIDPLAGGFTLNKTGGTTGLESGYYIYWAIA
tara:strand:+ start:856 stop:3102 length:2247 start_codon:yes stop_codon:yes gene_type:complete